MRGHVYILTVNIPEPTRIQCGCMGDTTMELLVHAEMTDTFDSFIAVPFSQLPKRDEDELRRGEAFIKDALDSNLTANFAGH